MATLHVHIDESGNFTFTPKGSRFFIFTAAWTYNPRPLSDGLSALKHRLIKEGYLRTNVLDDLSGFHACDDPNPRRQVVLDLLVSHADWNFASIVIEKNRVNPTLHDATAFYPKFLTMVLRFVLKGRVRPGTNNIIIYTDTLPMKSRAEAAAVNQTIKATCKTEQPGVEFRIMHHSSDSNYWLQVADYCSWSICRKWEHQDTAAYDRLRARLAATEIAPMSLGDGRVYY